MNVIETTPRANPPKKISIYPRSPVPKVFSISPNEIEVIMMIRKIQKTKKIPAMIAVFSIRLTGSILTTLWFYAGENKNSLPIHSTKTLHESWIDYK
jgi:hypothetical protein